MGSRGSLGLALLTAIVALATAAVWLGPVPFAIGVAMMPAGLLALVPRRGGGVPLGSSRALALALVAGGFTLLLVSAEVAPAERLGGLPLVLGVQVWVLAALPLVLLGLLFGLGFSVWRPSRREVEEIRRLAADENDEAAEGEEAEPD